MELINKKENIFGDNISFLEKANISKICNNYKTKKYKTKYQTCGGFKWKFKD